MRDVGSFFLPPDFAQRNRMHIQKRCNMLLLNPVGQGTVIGTEKFNPLVGISGLQNLQPMIHVDYILLEQFPANLIHFGQIGKHRPSNSFFDTVTITVGSRVSM